MAFDSLEYLLLLLATLGVFPLLRGGARIWMLVAASLLFYAAWSVPLVSLIAVSGVVDFQVGRRIHSATEQAAKRRWLALSLVTNLGLLGFFKYANFFLDNLRVVFGDTAAWPALEVALPPGISFYTFQTLSYSIDIYRGRIEPAERFGRYFLYVSFFPQLVAGPIERAGRMLGQFAAVERHRVRAEDLVAGFRLIAWGLFKKMVIADHCGLIADRVYTDPGAFDGWAVLVATYAFTLQIYCDFSAYSEIARGSARLFGVRLMINFDQPYLVGNVRDFWRRWHISLSTWFRDYVYFPLGGRRVGRARALTNLAITMFLSGLWHGAAWNFVLWGLFHGVLLLLHALVSERGGWQAAMTRAGVLGRLATWVVTFHLVVLGWMLFRVDGLADLHTLLAALGDLGAGPTSAQLGFIAATFGFLALSALERARLDADPALSAVAYATALVAAVALALPDGPQFIYFQF
jgi:D-alanyl-lipoteichoic acid acyltransferase DltB (MBOAT superfamily)